MTITRQATTGSQVLARATTRVARLRLAPIAVAAGFAIVLLGVLGIWHVHHTADLRAFDLDGETNVPAGFSAALLALAGCAVLVNGAVHVLGARWRWNALGVLFLFMALDEWTSIHEKLERKSGVDWQILYAPMFVLAGIAALMLVPHLRAVVLALQLFIAGSVAWGVSQLLEQLQWSGDTERAHYDALMVSEELLELTGSLLFLLAALTAFRAYARRRGPRMAGEVTDGPGAG